MKRFQADPRVCLEPLHAELQALINYNHRMPICMGIHPSSFILLHIHTSMTAIPSERLVAATIVMGELRARAKVYTPPRIMHEEAAPVVKNPILNWCIGIPVG